MQPEEARLKGLVVEKCDIALASFNFHSSIQSLRITEHFKLNVRVLLSWKNNISTPSVQQQEIKNS